MSVVTYKGHTKRAISWYNQDNIYMVIGRSSEWDDELNPPYPKPDDDIEEVICYKKVEQKYYVIQDDNGTIFYRGKMYRVLSEEEAWEKNCRWVFCSSWLNYDEAPVGVGYRQIGLCTDLEKNEGVPEGQYVLLPNEVKNGGDLEVLANDTVTLRSASKRERLAIIVEF